MQISELMTKNVITLAPDSPILDHISIFTDNKIHHIPVQDATGEVVGMVSSKDFENYSNITRILEAKEDQPILVKDIMTEPIFAYFENVEVYQAAQAMIDNHLHAIVVVNLKEVMTGILTSTDLLQYIVEQRK